MEDKRLALKSMLNNLINDNSGQASQDLHTYLTLKMRTAVGLPVADGAVGDSAADSAQSEE
jgi:hypothetical protein